MTDEHTPDRWQVTRWSVTELARTAASRDDLTVTITDDPPTGTRTFDPFTGRITLCANDAGLGLRDPSARVDTLRTRLGFPVLAGVVLAAAASAAHSRWITDLPADTDNVVAGVAWELDRGRAKARLLQRRPHDRLFLRAATGAVHVLDSAAVSTVTPMTLTQVLQEVHYRVLPRWAGEPVRDLATSELGDAVVGHLIDLMEVLRGTDDEDAAAVLAVARAWQDLWPENVDPSEPENAGLSSALGAACLRLRTNEQQAALDEAQLQADIADAAHTPSPEQVADIDQQHVAVSAAAAAFGPGTRSPVTYRPPEDADVAQRAVALARLRRAQYRAPQQSGVPVGYPTGRPRGSVLMQRAAQRAQNVEVTARPWRVQRWRIPPKPPMRVGLVIDLSGSMSSWLPAAGTAMWSVAAAVAELGGSCAAAGFAGDVVALLAPSVRPSRVPVLSTRGGSDGCALAMAAVTEGARLLDPGARIMIVLTDGLLPKQDRLPIQRHADFLERRQVPLVWALTGQRGKKTVAPTGAITLDNVSAESFPAIVTDAVVESLQRLQL